MPRKASAGTAVSKQSSAEKVPAAAFGGDLGGSDGDAVVGLVDRLQAVIKDCPLEYLDDIEQATSQLFALRRGEDDASGDEDAGEKQAKRRKLGKRGGLEELKALQMWLREKVPVEAVLPSEKLHFNPTGDFADYTAANTISVDSFLWEEADVDELCDAGKLPRNMCMDCGSRRTAPLNFVSHSLSIAELNFIFNQMLPSAGGVEGGVVVDVGSRLGSVVYAAVVLGGAKEAVGVEINEDMCKLQEEAFSSLGGAKGKAKVICGDISEQSSLLQRARLTVLHNPFQFFTSISAAQATWKKVASLLPEGSLIVASPPLSEQLAQTGSPLDEAAWVEAIAVEYPQAEDPDDEHADELGQLYTSCVLYRVKKRM